MFSRKLRNKKWHEYHSKKQLISISRKKEYKYFLGKCEFERNNIRHLENLTKHKEYRRIEKVAPKILSIQKNHEETINFFNEICEIRKECEHENIEIFINIENVVEVGVGAIMYLLAILRDNKSVRSGKLRTMGNYPKDEGVREKFINSGFLNYVQAYGVDIKPKKQNIKIKTGEQNDPEVAREVCGFVQQACNLERKDTIPLYNILIELMGNTNQHAYKDLENEQLANHWYLYAETNEEDISFVFLDTGLGIPYTVSKKWIEKLPFSYTDADFIHSALQGDCRTETKLKYRGKGLPQISTCCKDGIFKEVSVFAGKGKCYMYDGQQFKKKSYETKMNGTMFEWRIRRRKYNDFN